MGAPGILRRPEEEEPSVLELQRIAYESETEEEFTRRVQSQLGVRPGPPRPEGEPGFAPTREPMPRAPIDRPTPQAVLKKPAVRLEGRPPGGAEMMGRVTEWALERGEEAGVAPERLEQVARGAQMGMGALAPAEALAQVSEVERQEQARVRRGVPLTQLPLAAQEREAVERGELGGVPSGPSLGKVGLIAGTPIAAGLVAAGLPALALKFPVLSAFLLEQVGEETGIIPGRPVGRAVELASAPMKENLKTLGVPEGAAQLLSELVIFGAFGKAPKGQRGLKETLAAVRRLSKADVQKTLAAAEKVVVKAEVGAAGKVPKGKPGVGAERTASRAVGQAERELQALSKARANLIDEVLVQPGVAQEMSIVRADPRWAPLQERYEAAARKVVDAWRETGKLTDEMIEGVLEAAGVPLDVRGRALARAIGPAAAGKVPKGKPGKELQPGTRVRAADRDNLGTVASVDPEAGTARVHFYNRETKARATVTLKLDQLSSVAGRRARVPSVERLGAEAAARAEQAPPIVNKLYRALESASYVGARAERVAEIEAKRKVAAGAIGALRKEAVPETIEETLKKGAAARRGKTPAEFDMPETFTEAEVRDLAHRVFTSPALKAHEAENAGWVVFKLLQAQETLMPSEAKYLARVFPELAPVLGVATKKGEISTWHLIADALNIPRATRAAYDLSFPGRQGALLMGRKEWWQSIKPMVKAAASEDVANETVLRIVNHPKWDIAKRSKLAIADPGTGIGAELGLEMPFEETFISKMATKIPGIKHSQRAYTTAGNELRSRYFYNTLEGYEKLGIEYTLKDSTRLATWINIASGWGKLGPLEGILPELGIFIFSPRFWASRLQAIPYGTYLILANPVMRRQVAYDLASFTAINAGLLALAKYGIPGADVELDPRSTDWGRIRLGPLRIDTLAGFQPVIRTTAQLITGQGKDTATGEIYKKSRGKTLGRHGLSKLSPAAQFVADIMTGKTFIGEPVGDILRDPKEVFFNYFAPFVVDDVYEAVQEGGPELGWVAIPGAFGATVLTYRTPWQKLEDARDEVSQEREGLSLEQLREKYGTRKANDLLKDDEKVIAADEKIEERKQWYGGEGARRSLKTALQGFTREQEEADKRFLDNGEWREDRSDRAKRRAGFIAGSHHALPEQRDRMLKEREEVGDPFTIPDEWVPDDIVARYLAIYTDHVNPETGGYDDEDALYEDLDRFEALLSPAQANALEDNLGLQATAREKDYHGALGIIDEKRINLADKDTGFFDLPERLWEKARERDPWLARFERYDDLVDEVKRTKPADKSEQQALGLLAKNHAGLSWYLDRSRSNTDESYLDRYRRDFPEVDVQLVAWRFRDYEKLLTKEAQKLWEKTFGTTAPGLRGE